MRRLMRRPMRRLARGAVVPDVAAVGSGGAAATVAVVALALVVSGAVWGASPLREGRPSNAVATRLLPGEAFPALAPGDVIRLAPGVHRGPWRVDVPNVSLLAEAGAELDGGGDGSALTLAAPGIRVVGLHVIGVGPDGDLYEPDAAFALDGCSNCVLEAVSAAAVSAALRIEDSDGVRVDGLDASGSGAGPGITAYYAPGLRLHDLRLEGFLDGLYLERSDGLRVTEATLVGSGRYGVHLMFNCGAHVERVVATGGGVGSAVMYGRDTLLRHVTFSGHHGPMAFGLLVQEEQGARIEDATLRSNTIGLLALAAPGLVVRGADFDANGFGTVLQRLPAAFDSGDPEQDTSLVIEASRFQRNAFDLALDDDAADVRLSGNAYDRAAPLDFDGDGTLDLQYVVGTSLGALAARVPDVSLLAFGPAMVLWEALEARVPGVRFGMLADPEPRASVSARADGAGRTWGLGLVPLAGVAWALRPRAPTRAPRERA